MTTPYEALRAIATQQVAIGPRLEHVELYTLGGLLSMFWHWPDGPAGEDPAGVVICGGGAMGGMLGPADGLYHDLGATLAAEHRIALVRVGWRQPNDLDECTLDALGALQLATRRGAPKAVMVGHSFGGAVAVRAGVAADEIVAGVITLATQSAGCEIADGLAGRPVLCLHGTPTSSSRRRAASSSPGSPVASSSPCPAPATSSERPATSCASASSPGSSTSSPESLTAWSWWQWCSASSSWLPSPSSRSAGRPSPSAPSPARPSSTSTKLSTSSPTASRSR